MNANNRTKDGMIITEMSRNDRIAMIDFVRGIAILLVLWGHAIQYSYAGSRDFFDNDVYKAIYSFHMPLFMLLSGYVFYLAANKRSLKELIVRRVKALMQPIILCGVIYYYLSLDIKKIVNGNIYVFFSGSWLSSLGDYWFLWSVLCSSLVVGMVYKSFDKRSDRCIFLLFGVVFVAMFPNAVNNVYMYPYFIIGFGYAKYKDSLGCLSRIKYLFFILFALLLCFYRKEHLIYISGMSNVFLMYIVGLLVWQDLFRLLSLQRSFLRVARGKWLRK